MSCNPVLNNLPYSRLSCLDRILIQFAVQQNIQFRRLGNPTGRQARAVCLRWSQPVNRVDFQNLAAERLSDAEALLAADRFNCAYYIAGYAVECALKACIAHRTKEDDFPPRETRKIWTHDLVDLLDSAGLKAEFSELTGRDPGFESSWGIVKDWSESSRYENDKDRVWAEMMLGAIGDPQNGILQWLKKYW